MEWDYKITFNVNNIGYYFNNLEAIEHYKKNIPQKYSKELEKISCTGVDFINSVAKLPNLEQCYLLYGNLLRFRQGDIFSHEIEYDFCHHILYDCILRYELLKCKLFTANFKLHIQRKILQFSWWSLSISSNNQLKEILDIILIINNHTSNTNINLESIRRVLLNNNYGIFKNTNLNFSDINNFREHLTSIIINITDDIVLNTIKNYEIYREVELFKGFKIAYWFIMGDNVREKAFIYRKEFLESYYLMGLPNELYIEDSYKYDGFYEFYFDLYLSVHGRD